MNNNEVYRKSVESMKDESIPIYFQPWFLDANCGRSNWVGLVFHHKGDAAALFTYFYRYKWGIPLIDMPHFTKYMGPWVIEGYRSLKWENKIFQFFIEQLPRRLLFRQNFHPTIKNWMPFYWEGFQQNTAYTYRLNHQSQISLWSGLNRNVKRNIKAAEEAGMYIEEGHDLQLFYKLNCQSFERQGLKIPYDYVSLSRHDQALSLREKRRILFCYNSNGEAVAGCYLMLDKNFVYYHFSGEQPSSRHLGAGIFLLWKAICWSFSQSSIAYFDFEGSMIKGVESVRRQFGAYQVPYFKLKKFRFPWMALLTR